MNAYFCVHGVNISISSNSKEFIDFTKVYFSGFELPTLSKKPEIASNFEFKAGYDFRLPKREKLEQIVSMNTGWDSSNNRLHTTQREFIIDCYFNETWTANISFKKNLLKDIANHVFFSGKKTQYNYYRTAIRLVTQQLIFMKLNERGIIPLSAAACEFQKKSLITVGLPGSGKSTLIKAVSKIFDSEILTENFVLTDGKYVYPFPEGVSKQSKPIELGQIFFLTHGDKFYYKEISKDLTSRLFETVNQMTAELPQHSFFASLLLINPEKWDASFSDKEVVSKICNTFDARLLNSDNHLSKTIAFLKML